MTKGTTSFGPRHNKTHTACIRCGCRAFHNQKKRCASCGYPDKRMRHYNWARKAHHRRVTGVGRRRHLRLVQRLFHSGNFARSLKRVNSKDMLECKKRWENKKLRKAYKPVAKKAEAKKPEAAAAEKK